MYLRQSEHQQLVNSQLQLLHNIPSLINLMATVCRVVQMQAVHTVLLHMSMLFKLVHYTTLSSLFNRR